MPPTSPAAPKSTDAPAPVAPGPSFVPTPASPELDPQGRPKVKPVPVASPQDPRYPQQVEGQNTAPSPIQEDKPLPSKTELASKLQELSGQGPERGALLLGKLGNQLEGRAARVADALAHAVNVGHVRSDLTARLQGLPADQLAQLLLDAASEGIDSASPQTIAAFLARRLGG